MCYWCKTLFKSTQMKNIKNIILVGLVGMFFSLQLYSQNIGVSGAFNPSTVENCQNSELTIYFSNEDFINTVSSGDAMIEVSFPVSGEYTTPTNPPTVSSPALFSWMLNGNTWTGMLAGDVAPLTNIEIIFEVTAVSITAGMNTDLEVTLLSVPDLNEVNNTASPTLQIIENDGSPIDQCPALDQGTFACINQIPLPALTVMEFELLFGNNVFDLNFCMPFTITFFDDTSSMNSGCSIDPIILTRSYVFDTGILMDTCIVQYTIIDDVAPQVTCQDITIELDANGMFTLDPEDLSASVTNNCTGNDEVNVTFSVSNASFSCSDLNPQAPECANIFEVTLYAQDPCGNIDSCTANVTVIDNTPPTIDCPANNTINLQPGNCTTTYLFDLPTASDNCDNFGQFTGMTSLSQIGGTTLTSGDTFEPGFYTWIYEAMDGCGNMSNCTFTLEVVAFPIDDYILSLACNDLVNISLNEDCSVELGADMILEGGPYKCYEEYIIEIEGISGVIITSTGEYTVTITDPETGNSCWSKILIEDKLPPVIECEHPLCEFETLEGEWDSQNNNFLPDPICWNFDSGAPLININYDLINIEIQVAGDYTFTMTDDSNFDGIAALYLDAFDPANSCLNLIEGDDDLNGVLDTEPEITVSLLVGSYVLVSSSRNIESEYEWTYSGPALILSECKYKCFEYNSIQNEDLLIPLPIVTDCSDFNLNYNDSFTGDDCTGKVLTRNYVATDINGLSSSCTLTFDFSPINITDDIILPHPLVELSCGNGTDPQDIANYFDNPGTPDNPNTEIIENNEGFVYAYPTYLQNGHYQKIDNNVCSISAVFSDLELTSCGEGCPGNRKKIRTWTILDWCNSEILYHKQTIKSVDKDAPTLVSQDITISADPWVCEASFDIPLPINLHDDCDASPRYDISGPAGIIIVGSFESGFSVIDAPKGIYTFYYNAYDCCGNEESYPFTVFIYDTTPPTAVAKLDIVVSLTIGNTSEDAYAKMFAESVDDGSHDGCSDILKLELRRDTDPCGIKGNTTYNADGHPQDGSSNPGASNFDSDDGAFVKFCCEDVTNAVIDVDGDGVNDIGYVKVWFRVWDDGDMDGYFGSDGDNYNEAWVHVKVEDKLDPIINCPADVTIACDSDPTDLLLTGTAEALGTCGNVDVEYSDIVTNLDACGEGFIRRRWRVVGNSSISCDQTITIENLNLSTPIVSFSQVGNFTAVGCPDMISVGEPTWMAEACDAMTYTVHTDTFKFEDGACFKLLREYTVVNWCDYAPNDPQWVETDDFTDGLVRHIQVIKVTDETKPEIALCADQMFEVNDHGDVDNDGDLCEGKIVLINSATDEGSLNCPTGWLKWEVIIDLWSDGVDDYEYNSNLPPFDNNFNDTNGNGIPDVYVAPTQNGDTIRISLPDIAGSMSNHKVTWKVSDGCTNIDQCSYDFMVVDKKAPTPYCIDINTAVMDPSGTVALWAIDFNIGSFDNCTSPDELRYTFSSIPPTSDANYDESKRSSFKIFDCDDVINSPVEVNMYVWDEKGNSDFCLVYLALVDNNESCGNNVKIAGQITSAYGEVASGIKVSLNSLLPEYPRNGITDENGEYTFNGVALNLDYEISAKNDVDYLNGVSTLDLVIIQRHILGLESLNSPYKLIASDINSDHSVKAGDLLQLRKLILGIITDLPSNESWRFVDASQEINMDTQLEDVNFVRKISNLKNDELNNNLIAVKIGDVTENAVTNLIDNNDVEKRSKEGLEFLFQDRIVKKGEFVQVEFSSINFIDIYGYQFTMNLNGLEFSGLDQGILDMSDESFGILDSKTITASYNNSEALSVNENESLFTLNFISNKNGSLKDMIALDDRVIKAEAYSVNPNGGIDIMPLSSRGAIKSNDLSLNKLYQNKPNPFKENTVIGFDLIKEGPVKLSIYDVTGRELILQESIGTKGYNSISLNSSELKIKGLVIYKIESGDFIDSKRMIIIK